MLPFVFASTRKFFSKLYWALHQHSTSSAPSRLCAMLQGHEAVSNVFFALEEPGDLMRDMELFTFFPCLGGHFSASSISKAFLNVRCADACPTVMGTELWGRLKAWAHVDSTSLGITVGSYSRFRRCFLSFPVRILGHTRWCSKPLVAFGFWDLKKTFL